MAITPYEYQVECLDTLQNARNSKKDCGLVVMATGLGKTYTAALDVKKFHEEYGRGRTLFLCHRNDILEQSSIPFSEVHGPGYTYGFYHGQNKFGHSADFVFASLQTMQSRVRLFDRDEFDYVIVDESHHSRAETYERAIEYWRPKFMLGLTATPERADEKSVQEIFGEVLFNLPLEVALARRLLTPVDYRLLSDEIDLSGILGEIKQGKRISIADLNSKIFIPKRDAEIARIIKKHMDQIENPRVIIFCRSVKHANKMAELMEGSMGIHSKIKSGERKVRLELFKQGITNCAVTVDVFNEGIDIPQANLLVFLRTTSSKQIFFQQLGRGVRKSEGKTKLTVLDFVGNCERIQMIKELTDSIRAVKDDFDFGSDFDADTETKVTHQDIELNVEGIVFDEKIIQVIDIINRVTRKRDTYSTYQEASNAAKALGLKTKDGYLANYRKDWRLPSNPQNHYPEFTSWPAFLGQQNYCLNPYNTWQEAGKAAASMGIKDFREYQKRFKEDPRLPGSPYQAYPDFPGFPIFIGLRSVKRCKTWKVAGRIAASLGIKTYTQYKVEYLKDERLPKTPETAYPDFPGYRVFLGHDPVNKYKSLASAKKAVKKLGIKSGSSYRLNYKKDPRLPAVPKDMYKDFAGWTDFLGQRTRCSNPYSTWQQASEAAKKMGFKSMREYKKGFKKDPNLTSHPNKTYKDYPGYKIFFGQE